MATTVLPFAVETAGIGECDHGSGCSLHLVLPRPLRDVCSESEFLAEYLHHLPMSDIGIPAYYPKLSRSLSQMSVRNLIYPIEEGLFVHVYPDPTGARDHYVPIEPTVVVDIDTLMHHVDERLVDWAESRRYLPAFAVKPAPGSRGRTERGAKYI
jgi:flagellar protein FlaI